MLFLRYKYKVDANLYPLHEEIKYTNHYLEIQKIRFGHRLTISFTVNEEVVDELTIPFLLQTLVENAFKHGIEEIEEPSLLIITVEREQDRVVIKVIDDGPGFTSEGDIKLGTGLKNVTDRLNLIYGDQAELILKNNVGRNGASVTVSWPIGFKKVE